MGNTGTGIGDVPIPMGEAPILTGTFPPDEDRRHPDARGSPADADRRHPDGGVSHPGAEGSHPDRDRRRPRVRPFPLKVRLSHPGCDPLLWIVAFPLRIAVLP